MRYDLIKSDVCTFKINDKEVDLVDVLRKLVMNLQKAVERYRINIDLKMPILNLSNIENNLDINEILEIFERINILINVYHKSKTGEEFCKFQSDESYFSDYMHHIIVQVCEIERYLRVVSLIEEIKLINKSFKIEYKDNDFYQTLKSEYNILHDKVSGYVKRIMSSEFESFEKFEKDLKQLQFEFK